MWSEGAGAKQRVRRPRWGWSLAGALSLVVASPLGGCGGPEHGRPAGPAGDGSGSTAGAGIDSGIPADPIEAGLPLWQMHCASCHGDFETGSTLSSGNANGDFRLDVDAAIQRHGEQLEAYIDMAMPLGSARACTGECADTLGAYLRSLQMAAAEMASCEPDVGPAVGARQVMLLSSREYQNALEDLLGVPADLGARVQNHDGRRGGFVDMSGRSVSGTLLDTYTRNAETAVQWAVENGRPFSCTDASACANRFVDEFLFLAFRGPVSDEQKAAYRELFSDYPEQGLELALKAALTSPFFLYRIEVGVPLEEARAAGYYAEGTGAGSSAGGDPGVPRDNDASMGSSDAVTEVRAADQFEPGGSGYLSGDVWTLDQNGSVRVRFSAPLTDSSALEVVVRGSNHGDVWPELTLRVDGVDMGTQRIDTPDLQAYRFVLDGAQGSSTVELVFANDSGEAPYGAGMDANLYVQEVRLYTAGSSGGSAMDAPSLPAAASTADAVGLLGDAPPDAQVLTPYELASALALRLTGSVPDLELLEAARQGLLATRTGVRSQVERLIESQRGRAQMGHFVTRWFRLDSIDQVSRPDVPELTDEVKAAMLEEVRSHFLHVFYDDAAPYSEFFGGDYTFLNDALAEFYGVDGEFDQSFRKTPVEGRGGPLASGAFMTVNAHADRTAPILRAVRARETALCHYIDPPNSPIAGDDIDAQRAAAQQRVTAEEEAAGVLSSRDFYFLYTDGIDACAGCHESIINPMFGMEDFDHVGRLRPSAGSNTVLETVHGQQVEVSLEGTLIGIESTSDPATLEYAGTKDLSNQLAQTDALNTCLARKAFRFVTGATYVERDLDAAHQEALSAEQRGAYGCVARKMLDAFERSQQSPRAMFIELATDSLLLLRR